MRSMVARASSNHTRLFDEGERTERSLGPLVADLILAPGPVPFGRIEDSEESTHLAEPLENATVLEMPVIPSTRPRRSRRQRWLSGALSIVVSALVGAWFIQAEVERIDREKLQLLSENESLRTGKKELAQRVRTLDNRLERAALALEARRSILESLPIVVPVDAVQTSGFGSRTDPFTARRTHHDGIDYGARHGDPVLSTAEGKVEFAGIRGTYGKVVVIDHGSGLSTRYAHLSKIDVKEGEVVKRGQRLGAVGTTGRSTAPHLHYEVWADGQPLDPAFLMRVWSKFSGTHADFPLLTSAGDEAAPPPG